jgi:hypothetical protein
MAKQPKVARINNANRGTYGGGRTFYAGGSESGTIAESGRVEN